MASISKRGNKQWRVRVRRKGQPVQTRTFDTKFDAEAWARSVETEMDRGAYRDRRLAETTTLAEALNRWETEQMPYLAASTRRTEASRVRRLRGRPIAYLPLATVRSDHIAAHIEARKAEGAKPNTIRLELALLGRVFKLATTAWGMGLTINPVAEAAEARPRIPGGRTRRVSPEEEASLIECAPDELKPIIPFAIATAMRRGEISALSWDKVRLDRGILTLHGTKNGESRTVPLSGTAIRVLKQLSQQQSGPVFDVAADWISKHFKLTVDALGLTDLRFHDLRHEATSRLFERTSLDAMEIRKITGHKTMQMLARYTHLRSENLVSKLAGV